MRLSLFHETRFSYQSPVTESVNEARLQPCTNAWQTCESFYLETNPVAEIGQYKDFYRNNVHVFDIVQSHRELVVRAFSEVETFADTRPAPDSPVTPAALAACNQFQYYDFLQASPFIPNDPEVWRRAVDICPQVTDFWADSQRIMAYVYDNFIYDPEATTVRTSPAEALRLQRGVCQDYAHATLALLRALKIPARYVSGYFWAPQEDNDPTAGASHAWVEAFIPGFGWYGLDPTHNRHTDDVYVKVAVGRDYTDIRPLAGTFRGEGTREMAVRVTVDRLDGVQ